MKTAIAILGFLVVCLSAPAQHYLRGEIKDEQNNAVPNVRIFLHSTGYVYHSGSSGLFGIMLNNPADSITISLDGYQQQCLRVEANKYQQIVLRMLYASATIQRNKLVSLTKDLKEYELKRWNLGGETYSSLIENDFIVARKFSEVGFAMRSDKASYSNIRRFLNMNTTVPPDAVRTEEVLNYFNFEYQPPPKDSVFGFRSYLTDCPWNNESQLMFLHICAKKIDPEKIPPSNLVFLIDVSGSMDLPNRLPLLKSGFKLLVDNLREKDTVSIVVYGSTVGVWLPPTSGIEKEKIRKSIEELTPGGATPGESGIRSAYRLAKSQFIRGGNNRVILATDGDFNVGQSDEDELDKLITQHQQYGIYLTCLGVGMGNYKDSKLEVLAKKGNGNFAYLDSENEAEKVLVKELTQTLYTVADDVSVRIQFNPSMVREYRLLGFDNKAKALADSMSELEGGEVGSGQSMLALIEIKSASQFHIGQFQSNETIAKVQVSYENPGDSVDRFTSYSCSALYTPFEDMQPGYRFAASLAMFSSILKDSKYARQVSWFNVTELASHSYDSNIALHREFLGLIDKAKKIYGRNKKKKKIEN